jgi:hypothetical protein
MIGARCAIIQRAQAARPTVAVVGDQFTIVSWRKSMMCWL